MVTAPLPTRPTIQQEAIALESMYALADLVARIRSLGAVQRIALSSDGLYAELWVLMSHEDLDQMEQVHLFEHEVRTRRGPLPLNVRVLDLSRVGAPEPMESTTLFER